MVRPQGEPVDQPPIVHLLDPGERVELGLWTESGELRLTDRRIVVTSDGLVRLNVAYDELRRVQFDIEALRPAAMVIVPHRASDPPQVLAIPVESLHRAAEMLAFIGERLPRVAS
jgi:hypothetical protein